MQSAQNPNTLDVIAVHKTDRTVAFFDGANMWATGKSLEFDFDYKSLLGLLQDKFNLISALYYSAVKIDPTRSDDHVAIRPILDWLSYNGFVVVEKPAKVLTDSSGNVIKIKGNMDVEIAVHAMEAANYATIILLFTGDGDFTELVRALQRKGVRVIVFSSIQTKNPMIADELRRQANHFVELNTLREVIGRRLRTDESNET